MDKLVPAPHGCKGFDTVATISLAKAKQLKAAGYTFAIRYLGGITKKELNDLLNGGLGVMFVQYGGAANKWQPTADLGAKRGQDAATAAQKLGLPPGAVLWVDVESVAPGTSDAQVIAYVNAWHRTVRLAGFEAGLYYGCGVSLDAEELYHLLSVSRYWKSASKVAAVAHRGYMMIQHLTITECGVNIDPDDVQVDQFGGLPVMLIREAC